MQRNKLISILTDDKTHEFIIKNLHEDPTKLALRFSDKGIDWLPELITLISLYQKFELKLPTWTQALCALERIACEQATSEAVARNRFSRVGGKLAWDLTGGLGVDSFYLSKRFERVIVFEKNPELVELLEFNFKRLGSDNIEVINDSAENAAPDRFGQPDLIYLDPDRRPGSERTRKFLLNEYQPDLGANLHNWLGISALVMCKISPMVDVHYLIATFSNLHEISVVSEQEEVKEILLTFKGTVAQPILKAIDIGKKQLNEFVSAEPNGPESYSEVMNAKYVFEPSGALIKSGLAREYCRQFGLNPLAVNSQYYVSQQRNEANFGRWFEVISAQPVSWKVIRKYLKDMQLKRVMIGKRNFPESVDQIRKKLGNPPDGGSDSLLFTTDSVANHWCLHSKLLAKD